MILRKFRLQKGLSQEQLSAMSGVSTRTIHRIERGAGASTETLKCLDAALEIDFTDLRPEDAMTSQQNGLSDAEREALEYVRDIKGFFAHALQFAITIAILIGLNLWLTPTIPLGRIRRHRLGDRAGGTWAGGLRDRLALGPGLGAPAG